MPDRVVLRLEIVEGDEGPHPGMKRLAFGAVYDDADLYLISCALRMLSSGMLDTMVTGVITRPDAWLRNAEAKGEG